MGIKFASHQELPQDCVLCQGLAYGFQFPGEKGSTDPVQPLVCCFFTGNSRNSQMDGYSMMFLCFPREHGTVRETVFSPYDRAEVRQTLQLLHQM